MSKTTAQRAHAALKWINDVKAFSEELERVGSIDAMVEKAQAELQELRDSEERIRASLNLQVVKAANAEAQNAISAARTEAEQIVSGAQKARKAIVEEAKRKAEEIITAAQAKAAEIEGHLATAHKALADARS